MAMATMIIYFSSFLCLYLLLKFLNRVWWNPIRIQSFMKSQGIKGPSYKFLYGNTKDILSMKQEVMSGPNDLTHDTFRKIQPHFYTWVKLYGMNFLNWNGPRAQLVITEPDLVRDIFNSKDGTFTKNEGQGLVRKLLGDGLVTANGEKWAKIRPLASHAFRGDTLKNMIPAMITSMETMLEKWRKHEGTTIEVFEEYRVVTLDILVKNAFGSSYLEAKDLFDMLMKMGILINRTFYKMGVPVIGKFLTVREDIEAERLDRKIRGCTVNIIKKRESEKKQDEQEYSYGTDFLGLLVNAYHETDKTKKITLQDLIDECKTFFIAGHETIMSTLTWTTLLLAVHTDWQEKARKEIFELFGRKKPTPDNLGRLRILNMIFNETLRLYTPALNITRIVQKDVRLGKIDVPKGMEIFISPLAIHQNPKIWGEDACLFKPERFAEGAAKATNSNIGAYIPFATGPRACVGQHFALMQIKVALCMILQQFRFTLSSSYVHSPLLLLVLRPQYGLPIDVQPL